MATCSVSTVLSMIAAPLSTIPLLYNLLILLLSFYDAFTFILFIIRYCEEGAFNWYVYAPVYLTEVELLLVVYARKIVIGSGLISLTRIFFLFFSSLFKTSRQLIWSVFGLTDLQQMETHTSLTSNIAAFLYLIFLVLSVIMLVNMLVALLTNTYQNVTVR